MALPIDARLAAVFQDLQSDYFRDKFILRPESEVEVFEPKETVGRIELTAFFPYAPNRTPAVEAASYDAFVTQRLSALGYAVHRVQCEGMWDPADPSGGCILNFYDLSPDNKPHPYDDLPMDLIWILKENYTLHEIVSTYPVLTRGPSIIVEL